MTRKLPEREGRSAKIRFPVLILSVLFIVCAFKFATRHVDNYFPLEAGVTLEYEYLRTKGEQKEKGRLQVTNLPPETLEDRKVVPRKYEMHKGTGAPQTYVAYFHPNGNGIWFWALKTDKDPRPQILPQPFYYVKNPLESGSTWGEAAGPRGRLESISETLTVPAGSFKNCLKVKVTFPADKPLEEATLWFAEKVGIIKSLYRYRDGTEELFRLTGITEKGN